MGLTKTTPPVGGGMTPRKGRRTKGKQKPDVERGRALGGRLGPSTLPRRKLPPGDVFNRCQ